MEGRDHRVSHGAHQPSRKPCKPLGLNFLISEMGMTTQTLQAVGTLSRIRGPQQLLHEGDEAEMLLHSPES